MAKSKSKPKFYVNTETKEIHKERVKGSGCYKSEVLKKNIRNVEFSSIPALQQKEKYSLCGHCMKEYDRKSYLE